MNPETAENSTELDRVARARVRHLRVLALVAPALAVLSYLWVEPFWLMLAMVGSFLWSTKNAVLGLLDPLRAAGPLQVSGERLSDDRIVFEPGTPLVERRMRIIEELDRRVNPEESRWVMPLGRLAYGVGAGGWAAAAGYMFWIGDYAALAPCAAGIAMFGGGGVAMEYMHRRERLQAAALQAQLAELEVESEAEVGPA